MTRTSTIVGLFVAAALLAAASLIFALPSHAADPVCDYTYDEVARQFADAGSPVQEIDPVKIPEMVADLEAKTGQDFGTVTRAFVAQAGGKFLLGLEENGCLSPPIFIGFAGTAPAGRSA